MKLLLIILLIVNLSVLTGCKDKAEQTQTSLALKPDSSNGLTIEPMRYDLGEMSKNIDKGQFRFVISNNSSDTIIVNSVEAKCDCVNITSHPDTIFPTKQGEISGFIRIDGNSGHVNKPIFIRYNSDNIVLVRIIGDII